MAKKKRRGPSDEWIGEALKEEREAAYKKKKKKAKAKRDAKIQAQDNAKRKASQIAIKKIKAACKAVQDYRDLRSSTTKGFVELGEEAIAIKEEILKLEEGAIGFWAKK